MTRKALVGVAVATVALLLGSGAGAAVTFDPETGTGFVGKGDVQLVMGWNNKALQDNAASLQFRSESEVVTEVSWTCTKDNGNTQVRERTTTVTAKGVLASVARERNQITGFNLTGYSGSATVGTVTDGPPLDSCPTYWELTVPAGDPELISSSGDGLQVRAGNTGTWVDL